MAPEILKGVPYRGIDVDIFSFGVMLITLCPMRYPFDSASASDPKYAELMGNNPSGFWNYYGEDLSLTDELKSLCKLLLQEDPSKRGTMTDLICHPWMNGEKITQEEFACKYD